MATNNLTEKSSLIVVVGIAVVVVVPTAMRCELWAIALCAFIKWLVKELRNNEPTHRRLRGIHQIKADSFFIVPVEPRSTASCAVLFARAQSLTTLNENCQFVCSLSWSGCISLISLDDLFLAKMENKFRALGSATEKKGNEGRNSRTGIFLIGNAC